MLMNPNLTFLLEIIGLKEREHQASSQPSFLKQHPDGLRIRRVHGTGRLHTCEGSINADLWVREHLTVGSINIWTETEFL